jgi:hypothetical protein
MANIHGAGRCVMFGVLCVQCTHACLTGTRCIDKCDWGTAWEQNVIFTKCLRMSLNGLLATYFYVYMLEDPPILILGRDGPQAENCHPICMAQKHDNHADSPVPWCMLPG